MGEFKRNNKIYYTRTANTLRHERVNFVLETEIDDKKVIVVKLSGRVKRIHYIVYYADDLVDEMYDWDDVTVITEIEKMENKFRFCIKPSNQFEHLNLDDKKIYEILEKLLTEYEICNNISHVDKMF